MLKQLSRLERTRSLIIVVFAVLMAVSLVIFYAPGRNNAAVPASKNTEVLAVVGKEEITVADLVRHKDNLQKRFGGQFNIAQLGTDRRFLDELIQRRIVSQEAERLGLVASDAEVAERIRKQFPDPGGQFVGFDRYREIVVKNYGDLEAFEQELRDNLTAQKLRAFMTAGVRVAPEEVEDDYKRKNTTFDLTYVTVDANKLLEKIQPSEQDLRAYYDQHKAEYHINVPQKKIRYLFINKEKMAEKLSISDEELKKEYDALTPENKQAGVKIQQIVLKVARPDLDAQVKEKADKLVAQARAEGGSISEEKFAELARGNSEDTNTAKNGGWIPFIVKRDANKPDDPLQQTLEMQTGAVTEPIKYSNAYFIFRRGNPVEKTFDEAKKELLVSARNKQSFGVAATLAARAVTRAKELKDLQKVAQEIAAEANMTPAEMIKETGFIKPGDEIKDIGVSQDFENGIAPLQNVGDIGDRIPVKNGFAIPMVAEKKEPRDAEFDEVKDTVTGAVKKERALAQLEQTARDIAANSKSPSDLKAAAEKYGLEAKTSEGYKLGTPLGDAGANPIGGGAAVTDEAIYAMKEGEVTKTPVKVGDNWMVIGATKRTEADLAEFAKQREALTDTMVQQRRDQVFGDYIAGVQARLLREGKIKVNTDVLARMAEDAPPSAAPPGFPQGMPQGFPPPQ
ncbi:MAG: peptidyl-prolyl cis-trans isomerase [Pyrinomonadaceae bacterium]|nr:peptidyl-prolyl cis-trans isomerase [Pyrinomonadaceae bacterium]